MTLLALDMEVFERGVHLYLTHTVCTLYDHEVLCHLLWNGSFRSHGLPFYWFSFGSPPHPNFLHGICGIPGVPLYLDQ